MADITVTASSVVSSTTAFDTYKAATGVTIVAGEFVTLDNDGNLVKAQNTTDALSVSKQIFMALSGGSPGQPITVARPGSVVDMNNALTAATAYYLSGTAGKMCPRADLGSGSRAVQLCYAKSTTQLVFQPIVYGVTL